MMLGDLEPRVPRRRKKSRSLSGRVSDAVDHEYADAIAYHREYATFLTGWPKAVRVTSQPTYGKRDVTTTSSPLAGVTRCIPHSGCDAETLG